MSTVGDTLQMQMMPLKLNCMPSILKFILATASLCHCAVPAILHHRLKPVFQNAFLLLSGVE